VSGTLARLRFELELSPLLLTGDGAPPPRATEPPKPPETHQPPETPEKRPARQALRRLRLQLFFDERAWMFPVGAMTHCMITIPYWMW
jgi:hypothetical protein